MKVDLRPSSVMERMVKTIGLAFVAVLGLQILWSIVAPWLPIGALVIAVSSILRLWWWQRTRW